MKSFLVFLALLASSVAFASAPFAWPKPGTYVLNGNYELAKVMQYAVTEKANERKELEKLGFTCDFWKPGEVGAPTYSCERNLSGQRALPRDIEDEIRSGLQDEAVQRQIGTEIVIHPLPSGFVPPPGLGGAWVLPAGLLTILTPDGQAHESPATVGTGPLDEWSVKGGYYGVTSEAAQDALMDVYGDLGALYTSGSSVFLGKPFQVLETLAEIPQVQVKSLYFVRYGFEKN